jgi:hypothetical protein
MSSDTASAATPARSVDQSGFVIGRGIDGKRGDGKGGDAVVVRAFRGKALSKSFQRAKAPGSICTQNSEMRITFPE